MLFLTGFCSVLIVLSEAFLFQHFYLSVFTNARSPVSFTLWLVIGIGTFIFTVF